MKDTMILELDQKLTVGDGFIGGNDELFTVIKILGIKNIGGRCHVEYEYKLD